jgi:ribonuclease VapC
VIVDTSALAAIVFEEPAADEMIVKLVHAERPGIGSPTLVELCLVLTARLGSDPQGLILRLLDGFQIREVAFGPPHWREAAEAFLKYGRGRHPARLNFGDCLSYAVARVEHEPLLFVGTDFAATDVASA